MRKSGVKFGLIGSASSLKKGGASAAGGKGRPIGSKPVPRRRPPGATSVFDADSDDEEGPKGDPSGVATVNKRLAAISAKQVKQAKKEYEEALDADPSVFDYDRVYDGMKESRQTKVAAATVSHEKEKRQPKYIGNLLKQAKMRAVESDRIFERKLQKEREEQDKLEGEATMKFVTSAYKKKLMEQKKWELQQQLEEEREQKNDVTKTGMSGFYSNLITKNIAMGGDVEKSANSAFTAGSKRHAATADYEMEDGNLKSRGKAGSTDDVVVREDVHDGPALKEGDFGSEKDGEGVAPSAKMIDPCAAYARKNRDLSVGKGGADGGGGRKVRDSQSQKQSNGGDAGSAAVDGKDSDKAGAGKSRPREEGTGDNGSDTVKRARQEEAGFGEDRKGAAAGLAPSGVASEGGQEETEEERKAAEKLEKAKKEEVAKARRGAAIMAARERFFARKNAS